MHNSEIDFVDEVTEENGKPVPSKKPLPPRKKAPASKKAPRETYLHVMSMHVRTIHYTYVHTYV